MRLGLIINPIAGIGGRVGLKGSDGEAVQKLAFERGAVPASHERALAAFQALLSLQGELQLFTAPGPMGEDAARQMGFFPNVVGSISTKGTKDFPTTAGDTCRAAQAMRDLPVDLLLFAGGDGTARDICAAVGGTVPVLGIPAGVKIYSEVFATHPQRAGEIAVEFLTAKLSRLREAEVIDLDEDLYREGAVSTRLFGYLKIPYRKGSVQNKKAPTPASEQARAQAIAADVIERMQPGCQYILGPGTTTRAIAERLGMPKTLVGVDVYTQYEVVALDVGEAQLLHILSQGPARIIVTPIGGQGFLFGRGNQQIGPRVIEQAGKQNLMVICLIEKLNALRGRPFLVDTGDRLVDEMLSGYTPVITGYHEQVIYRIAS